MTLTAEMLDQATHARTFANSADGDMRKPSPSPDQAMSSCIVGSSNMLIQCQRLHWTAFWEYILVQLVYECSIDHFGLL